MRPFTVRLRRCLPTSIVKRLLASRAFSWRNDIASHSVQNFLSIRLLFLFGKLARSTRPPIYFVRMSRGEHGWWARQRPTDRNNDRSRFPRSRRTRSNRSARACVFQQQYGQLTLGMDQVRHLPRHRRGGSGGNPPDRLKWLLSSSPRPGTGHRISVSMMGGKRVRRLTPPEKRGVPPAALVRC